MVNKLVSASILANVKQIEIIMEDFSLFFDQHAEPTNNKKGIGNSRKILEHNNRRPFRSLP